MQGLRKQESAKFHKFFAIIQEEAKKQGAIFFADAGDGNDFQTAEMEGEDLMGWLVPLDKVEQFEPLWRSSNIDDAWVDFFKWAIWAKSGNSIQISFEG